MPIGKVWINRLLFVCNFVCLFVQLTDFSTEDLFAASNFAQRIIGVQGRESHILGNVAPPEAQNRPANRPANRPSRALSYK